MTISKRIGILSVLIFYHAFCYAQGEKVNSSKIDSLKKLLPTLHESARVDCLNELSESVHTPTLEIATTGLDEVNPDPSSNYTDTDGRAFRSHDDFNI